MPWNSTDLPWKQVAMPWNTKPDALDADGAGSAPYTLGYVWNDPRLPWKS